jgi:hypothetical protein
MRRLAWFVFLLGAVTSSCMLYGQQSGTEADGSLPSWLLIKHVTIPDADSSTGGLDGWMATPNAPGKHPLAVIGLTELVVPERANEVGPGRMLPEAEWFVRRGWAVGIFLRRGYGASGKFPHIGIIRCGTQDMEEYSDFETKDLRVALAYFSALPEVDRSRVIAGENSDVWADSIWLANGAPASLKGILNFGPRGMFDMTFYRDKCLQGSILPALRRLGETSHVPMLWVYGKVKPSGQESTKECLDAFVGAGGSAEFDTVKSYDAENASYLFNMDEAEWGPLAEAFLAKRGLPSTAIYAAPQIPDWKLPKGASDEAQKAFADYLRRGPNKAFALGANGAWAYRYGRVSLKIAEKDVLDNCAGCLVVASQGK